MYHTRQSITPDYETARFANLNGGHTDVQFGRRNGRRVPLFGRSCTDRPDADLPAVNDELLDELCYGLSPIERRTWTRLVHQQPVMEIAKEDGVSASAIYSRIRGSKKSRGMICKNVYVLLWWILRLRGELRH